MADRQSVVPAPRGAVAVTTCWMCGIRTHASQMVADGGGACADVRWYCLDVRGCTERWTARHAGSAEIGPESAGTGGDTRQPAGLPRRRPAGAGMGPGPQDH